MKLYCRVLSAGFLLVSLLVLPAYTQVSTADITGRVTDQQGRVVPGATVTATNKGTRVARTATTDDGGDYTITQLPPGKYDLSVEATSFSKALAQDFELNVGAKVTKNFELQPGEITATVSVSSEAAAVNTTSSELGKSITPTELQTFPLLNRTFANLSIVAPEARPAGTFDPTKTHVGNVAFSGGDGRQVDVNVDGGDNKDNVVEQKRIKTGQLLVGGLRVILEGLAPEDRVVLTTNGQAVPGGKVVPKQETIPTSFFEISPGYYRDPCLSTRYNTIPVSSGGSPSMARKSTPR